MIPVVYMSMLARQKEAEIRPEAFISRSKDARVIDTAFRFTRKNFKWILSWKAHRQSCECS